MRAGGHRHNLLSGITKTQNVKQNQTEDYWQKTQSAFIMYSFQL